MPKRVDVNQAEIVEILRGMGCSVQHMHELGKGAPDILVGYRGDNYLFEIKDPGKPPSARKLTDDEQRWHERWRGQVAVVTSAYDVIEILKKNHGERPGWPAK